MLEIIAGFGSSLHWKQQRLSLTNWHCNRHTFCSWLAMAGVSIKEIQDLAGHLTITMVARYAHLAPESVASAFERIVLA